ncbi:MAG TPA: c-type cytochrome domain-containing protein [Bryobacteraceae bacterium]|nr:c-type cytochrome domain-containing protein [Bryobacteraceae bacterium]
MRFALTAAVAICGVAVARSPASRDQRFFDDRVAPILTKRCLGCHNHELDDGGISFEDRRTLLKGGPHGPAVVPGKPEDSILIQAIRRDGDVQMPPGQKLSGTDIAILTEWVRRGAPWGTKLRPSQ